MTHNVVYLFSTPNLGNYQADMTISLPIKTLKIFSINNNNSLLFTRRELRGGLVSRYVYNDQISWTLIDLLSSHCTVYFQESLTTHIDHKRGLFNHLLSGKLMHYRTNNFVGFTCISQDL